MPRLLLLIAPPSRFSRDEERLSFSLFHLLQQQMIRFQYRLRLD